MPMAVIRARRALKKIMSRVNIEIVKRSDTAKKFVVLPKRWIVERTFAWLGRCRNEFQSESARVPASRVDPPHAEKAMQSRIMFPDKLLEHRNGLVGQRDAKSNGKMVLQFPRVALFVERDGKRIEITRGFVAKGEMLEFSIEMRRLEYEIGQRLILSAADFEQIAFACSQFAGDLARILPKQPGPSAPKLYGSGLPCKTGKE